MLLQYSVLIIVLIIDILL